MRKTAILTILLLAGCAADQGQGIRRHGPVPVATIEPMPPAPGIRRAPPGPPAPPSALPVSIERREATDQERAKAEAVILAILRDPESARFGEAFVVETQYGPRVCGTVNAKNGMGGYAGAAPFWVSLTDGKKALGGGELGADFVSMTCG